MLLLLLIHRRNKTPAYRRFTPARIHAQHILRTPYGHRPHTLPPNHTATHTSLPFQQASPPAHARSITLVVESCASSPHASQRSPRTISPHIIAHHHTSSHIIAHRHITASLIEHAPHPHPHPVLKIDPEPPQPPCPAERTSIEGLISPSRKHARPHTHTPRQAIPNTPSATPTTPSRTPR